MGGVTKGKRLSKTVWANCHKLVTFVSVQCSASELPLVFLPFCSHLSKIEAGSLLSWMDDLARSESLDEWVRIKMGRCPLCIGSCLPKDAYCGLVFPSYCRVGAFWQ